MGAALAIPAALMATGAIAKTIGGFQAASQTADQGEENLRLARLAAADARARGELEAGVKGMEGSAIIGKQKAGLAAGNIDVQVGTAADVQAQTRYVTALDQAVIRNNAWREAWGYEVQGVNAFRQAQQTASQMRLGAVASFLGGAGSIASMGAGYKGGTDAVKGTA